MTKPWLPCTLALVGSALALPSTARAAGPPSRDEGWNTATNVLAISSLAAGALMPRVFFSDPEVTAGWKARWHLSVLAPIMTLSTLALANEVSFKSAFGAQRPGCPDSGPCDGNGFMSTPSFAAGSALGQGVSVFLVDTLKWSGGNVNVGGLFGEVILPLVLAPITIVGRSAGNWESAGQTWSSGGIGLAAGLLTGFVYATLQRPECGYTGSLICW